MAEDKELARWSENPGELMNVPENMRPNDILQVVDAITKPIEDEVPPGFFRALVTPGGRELLKKYQDARIEKIQIRLNYVKLLSKMIDVYVQAHVDQLDARIRAALLVTFTQLTSAMDIASESALTTYLDTYAVNVARIRDNSVLTDDQKETQVKTLYARVEEKQKQTAQAFQELVAEVEKQVRDAMGQARRHI